MLDSKKSNAANLRQDFITELKKSDKAGAEGFENIHKMFPAICQTFYQTCSGRNLHVRALANSTPAELKAAVAESKKASAKSDVKAPADTVTNISPISGAGFDASQLPAAQADVSMTVKRMIESDGLSALALPSGHVPVIQGQKAKGYTDIMAQKNVRGVDVSKQDKSNYRYHRFYFDSASVSQVAFAADDADSFRTAVAARSKKSKDSISGTPLVGSDTLAAFLQEVLSVETCTDLNNLKVTAPRVFKHYMSDDCKRPISEFDNVLTFVKHFYTLITNQGKDPHSLPVLSNYCAWSFALPGAFAGALHILVSLAGEASAAASSSTSVLARFSAPPPPPTLSRFAPSSPPPATGVAVPLSSGVPRHSDVCCFCFVRPSCLR